MAVITVFRQGAENHNRGEIYAKYETFHADWDKAQTKLQGQKAMIAGEAPAIAACRQDRENLRLE
eukprot:7813501-Prorocentrum_lima.AAC.1